MMTEAGRRVRRSRGSSTRPFSIRPGLLLMVIPLVLSGCSRDAATRDAPPALKLGAPGQVELPDEASYAEKRGFCDIDGDGLTDMLEINDTAYIGQDWQGQVYLGRRTEQGLLSFARPYTVSFPLRSRWLSASKSKLDTADVNGDGFCDVVMTQYSNALLSDRYHIVIGMNQGDGKHFNFVEDISQNSMNFSELVGRMMENLGGNNDSIDSWLKMDWADMNGDGRDDLCMVWGTDYFGRHLLLEFWPSITPKESRTTITFGAAKEFSLPGFLTRLEMKNVDVEDMNGDGRADIVIYDPWIGTRIRIAYAENSGDRFVIHRDFLGREIEMDYFGFEKRDSFDINLDGCADYVHVGTQGRKRYASYLLSPCDARPAPKPAR